MYNYIEGKIVEINPAYAVIDCGGIGYYVNISLNTYAEIKDLERCRLFIYLHLQENVMALYGFYKELERRLFRHCISVNGVGVSTGLLILSSLPSEQLMNTIITENVAMLRAVKGIGEKTAMRIIIELKDKMAKEEPGETLKIGVSHNTKREEALSGLVILGFARLHAVKVVDKLLTDNPNISVESLIKESLRIL